MNVYFAATIFSSTSKGRSISVAMLPEGRDPGDEVDATFDDFKRRRTRRVHQTKAGRLGWLELKGSLGFRNLGYRNNHLGT